MLYNINDNDSNYPTLFTPLLSSPSETRKSFSLFHEDECDIFKDRTEQSQQLQTFENDISSEQWNDNVQASFDLSMFSWSKLYSKSTKSESSYVNNSEKLFDLDELIIQDVLSRSTHPKLYEFLRLLLDNECYASYASWLNKNEGLFKIHKQMEIANLWKRIKTQKTTRSTKYDTFARSIRYYYQVGLMIKTRKRKTYRFAHI